MTRTRVPAVAIAVLAIVAASGTGYAAFTASAYIGGEAAAGTLGPLTWGSYAAYGYGNDLTCSASTGATVLPLDTLDLVASNLVPGELCGYAADVDNHGSLPALVTERITSASGGLCSQLVFSDLGFTPGAPISLGATGSNSWSISGDSSVPWGGSIYLPSSASGAYVGLSCDFTVTLTGTAGT